MGLTLCRATKATTFSRAPPSRLATRWVGRQLTAAPVSCRDCGLQVDPAAAVKTEEELIREKLKNTVALETPRNIVGRMLWSAGAGVLTGGGA